MHRNLQRSRYRLRRPQPAATRYPNSSGPSPRHRRRKSKHLILAQKLNNRDLPAHEACQQLRSGLPGRGGHVFQFNGLTLAAACLHHYCRHIFRIKPERAVPKATAVGPGHRPTRSCSPASNSGLSPFRTHGLQQHQARTLRSRRPVRPRQTCPSRRHRCPQLRHQS